MPQRREEPAQGTGFTEAIAQWRLQLRTEVKRASSLPSSMFDACDPMLETRLCETAESMLNRLPQPAAGLDRPAPSGEQRIESVSRDELRRLPQRIHGGPLPPAELDQGLGDEFLAILADLCHAEGGTARERAAQLLVQECGLGADGDLDTAARQLWRLLPGVGEPMPGAEHELAALCRRIAATALGRAVDRTTDQGGAT
ncbi:MAG: hypothetical protein MUC36_09880 [Planctomycetes bacterium]|jgi:hypothetical protein|nr:hypothetical protein [Planctomycetota bacterium]